MTGSQSGAQAGAQSGAQAGAPAGDMHPIERRSFEILASRVDLSELTAGVRQVVGRVVHATADIGFATSLVLDEAAVDAGTRALAGDAVVVCDAEMVRAGLGGLDARCFLGAVEAGPGGFPTRSARAMRHAADRHPTGALVVVGCAPTALEAVIDLMEAGSFRPALVVGLPVGFVGAAESKVRLRRAAQSTGLPAISNVGERGGSAAACGAVNALKRMAMRPEGLR